MTSIKTDISSLDAVILRPKKLPVKDRGNGAKTVPLVGAHLGSTTFLNGITTFGPGAAIGHHSHNVVESVVVIEGTAFVDIDGTEHYLETYDTTFVPANIVHRFRNASETEEMKILWTYASIDATRTPAGSTVAHRIDAEQAAQPTLTPAQATTDTTADTTAEQTAEGAIR
jgi:putative monooxygenase